MSKRKKVASKENSEIKKIAEVKSAPALSRTLMIICALFAFALYANTLSHEFTVDDDMVIAKNNYTIQGIDALPKIFTTAYRAGYTDRNEGLFRPLSVAMFAVEWEVAGKNPFLFHLINVLLYALTAAVLFLTLLLMFEGKNLIIPFLIAILFVAHPVHTEVIANVKSGDEVLAFLFSLLAIFFSLKFVISERKKFLALTSITFFLALLSKESAVTIIILVPLTLYFFKAPPKKWWPLIAAALFLPLIIYLMIRFSVLNGITNFSQILLINNSLVAAQDDVAARMATSIFILGKYMLLLFIPHPLSYDYSYNSIPLVSFANPAALLSLLIIIALGVMAVKGLKNKSEMAYGIFFFAGTIALVSNIFILIEATMAERFLYMPSVGFCIAIVFVIVRIFKLKQGSVHYSGLLNVIRKNTGIMSVFGIVLLLFSAKTFSRNTAWKNNLTLLKHDIITQPNSARILYSIGSTLIFEKGLSEKDQERQKEYYRDGIDYLKRGLDLIPEYGDAWLNMGLAYNYLEDYKSAIPCFEQGFSHTTNPAQHFYIGAGIAYGESGNFIQSFKSFKQVLQKNDTAYDACNNMGMFMSRAGKYDSSVLMLQKAIALRPQLAKPLYNMGNTWAYQGEYRVAIEWYSKAINLEPNMAVAYVNMGNSYGAIKDYASSVNAFQKALEIDPSNMQARNNLGVTYLMMGDTIKAKPYLNVRK